MKFLEGKTPSERKKIIAALVLGLVSVCALFYTFLFSSSASSNRNSNNSNKNIANVNKPNSGQATTTLIPPPMTEDDIPMALPDNPFPVIDAPGSARNIFAFYEPPPPTPISIPTEKPLPPPSPVPTPPLLASYANPQQIYARTGDFTLEVGGDKFTPESKVFFNGVQVPTEFSSPQRLTAQISAQLVASEGDRQIMVRVPADEKLFSNPVMMNVMAPPVPNFNFVGLVARKRYNNDTALLQNKQTKDYINVRLNDPVPDRFRVVSISGSEVWVVDTALKLRHRLAYIDEKSAARAGVVGAPNSGGRGGGVYQQGYDPNVQYQEIPGIPNNIPRYVPPQPQTQPQVVEDPRRSLPNKNNDEDDDDPNR